MLTEAVAERLLLRTDPSADMLFWQGDTVVRIAETFNFSHGEKIVHREKENRGVMGAWRRAWTWRDRELFVVLEDDVEMSPHWYRAAVNMWQKYGDR